jgi:hypothetical protein
VQFVGADADLGSQAVLTAVGKARAGVDHRAGAIHFFHEFIIGFCDGVRNRVGVMAVAVEASMINASIFSDANRG